MCLPRNILEGIGRALMIKHLQPPLCRMDSPGVCTAPAQHLKIQLQMKMQMIHNWPLLINVMMVVVEIKVHIYVIKMRR